MNTTTDNIALARIEALENRLAIFESKFDALLSKFGGGDGESTDTPTPDGQQLAVDVNLPTLKWFTKRPMPDVEINIIDRFGAVVEPSMQVRVRLLSGHGLYVDQFVTAPGLTTHFPVHNGRAVLSGLKFNAVSSRNGGYFQFEVTVESADGSVLCPPVRSKEFRVLSERLKNECKANSFSELISTDPLARVPGIGKKYAGRLNELGVHTVRDLAVLNELQRRVVLEEVRRDRGSLTEGKLAELCAEAQSVVQRDSDAGMFYSTEPKVVATPPAPVASYPVKFDSQHVLDKNTRVDAMEDFYPSAKRMRFADEQSPPQQFAPVETSEIDGMLNLFDVSDGDLEGFE